ncbi:MAG TPA: MBL fold metallo-hydrolase, partial [Kofleriaceae bacterium]|nr:MBL fold metallo-hydrolase [Kofleriaceae bacterium]
LVPVEFHRDFEPANGVTARFARAGHIIGSGSLCLTAHGTSIAFTGDVGRPRDPIMMPPEPLEPADYLVVESTYGDRLHPTEDVAEMLARVVVETIEKRGVIIVPSFAVGRAQHLLHLLATLRASRRIPDCPTYLDSPLAIDATRVFSEHRDDHALSVEQVRRMVSVARYTQTADQSREIDRSSGPMIIVSASGMCTGGRVLHHLQRFLPDDRTTVLFVGYQAAGTRGRSLVDGATELKMFGGYVPVKARVVQLDGLSAHADYGEMISWLRTSKLAPRRVFVTHGEPEASDAFRRRLRDAFGWDARVPDVGEKVRL